ncbi:hypothetical protein KF707_14150 [Candidatus Obscuribacterales bacterium]|nr:hypothetical protein [Candidatus Obscuribacterales bacterium]MBX3149743.1 hypothetical protein [Candidatus Obscuribacterales bacterium]
MKTSKTPGLRNRFARGVMPLHMRLFGAVMKAVTWNAPLEKPSLCKTEGHKFDLKKWNGPHNKCEECGVWIKSHEQVRTEEFYKPADYHVYR